MHKRHDNERDSRQAKTKIVLGLFNIYAKSPNINNDSKNG